MELYFINLLKILYATVGVLGLLAFLPTIKDLHIHKKQSANVNSYLLWTVTSAVSFLYSVFILNDMLVRIISAVNLIACIVVLVLISRLKGGLFKKVFENNNS